MILLFVFFLILFFFYLRKRSVALFLVIIQLCSIFGSFFIGRDLKINDINEFVIIIYTGLLLYLIIAPWKYYKDVRIIDSFNEKKLRVLTRFFIIVCSISFFVLLTITIIVQSTITDINDFKYTPGVNESFITNNSPFPRILMSIAIIFSNFSFFILPLHFYYLHRNKIFTSILCFILSTNIMLIGFTYFSRAVLIQYALLYFAMLIILFGTFSNKLKNNIRKVILVSGFIGLLYFLKVSVSRFEKDSDLAKKYSLTIPVDAVTQDPLIFSYLDYLSQGYLNGFDLMALYEGNGFEGKLSLEKLLVMTTSEQDTYKRQLLRQDLWPYQFSYSFNGFPAYSLYDYGIIGSLLFCSLYFYKAQRMRPKKGVIKLENLFLIVIMIEIPIMSIFYSEVGGAIIAFVLYFFILMYLKMKGI